MKRRLRLLGWGFAALPLIWITVRIAPINPYPPLLPEPKPSLPLIQLTPSTVEPSSGPASPTKSSLPESPKLSLSKQLKLLATAHRPELAAWIQNRQTLKTDRYLPGALILDARLISIGSGTVWLERDGTLTQLHLEESPAPSVDDPSPAPSAPSITVTHRSDQAVFTFQKAENPLGPGTGLLVESTGASEWLRRLGLQEGDLILKINDQRLISPQQSMQVIRKALHQPSLNLSLRRSDQIQIIQRRRDL